MSRKCFIVSIFMIIIDLMFDSAAPPSLVKQWHCNCISKFAMLLPGMLNSLALSPELREWEQRLGRPLGTEELRLLICSGKLEPVADAPKLYFANGCADGIYDQGIA